MIVLIDGSVDLRVAAEELGCVTRQLITPLTGFRAKRPEESFAIDNGAYSTTKKFNPMKFMRLLKREEPRKKLCKFVTVPDVVGSARRTLECFDYWYPKIQTWPLAFVAQDGQQDLPIPWQQIKAVFIGGTTEFKMSSHAIQIIRAAQAMGKWVHVGRVNRPGRFEYFKNLFVDSVDGTGLSQYTWMREDIWKRDQQAKLELTA